MAHATEIPDQILGKHVSAVIHNDSIDWTGWWPVVDPDDLTVTEISDGDDDDLVLADIVDGRVHLTDSAIDVIVYRHRIVGKRVADTNVTFGKGVDPVIGHDEIVTGISSMHDWEIHRVKDLPSAQFRLAAVSIPDGGYYLWPEGSAWIYVRMSGGRIRSMTEEANLATHVAARDRFSSLDPEAHSPTSPRIVDRDTAEAIIQEVMGEDTDPELVWVIREQD